MFVVKLFLKRILQLGLRVYYIFAILHLRLPRFSDPHRFFGADQKTMAIFYSEDGDSKV